MTRRGRRQRFRSGVGRGFGIGLFVLVVALVGLTVAAMWPEAIDRRLHPSRYAVSGEGLVGADAYIGAARGALSASARIGTLVAPDRRGPVTASTQDDHATVFIDPPTARVLAVARGDEWGGVPRWLRRWSEHGRGADVPGRPLVTPAMTVERVLAVAARLGGGRWRRVDWPTTARADWTVSYAGGRVVKVADDAGGSVVVLARSS